MRYIVGFKSRHPLYQPDSKDQPILNRTHPGSEIEFRCKVVGGWVGIWYTDFVDAKASAYFGVIDYLGENIRVHDWKPI